MRIAKVTWLDAHSVDPWHVVPDKFIEYPVQSVGFLKELAETSEAGPSGVVLLSSVEMDQEVCFGVVHIPKGCITKIEFLDVEKPQEPE